MEKELVGVILAGGEGKRFWPLSFDKSLLPFGSRNFFEMAIRDALPLGLSRIVIVTNLENDQYFKRLILPVPHETIIQKTPNGMANAVLSAGKLIANTRLFIVLGDHAVDRKLLQTIVKKSTNPNNFGVVSGWIPETYFPGGYLVTDGDRVVSIQEKPGVGKEPSKYVYVSGVYIADSDLFLHTLGASESKSDDVFEQALTRLMKSNRFVWEPYKGFSITLKYPWHVLEVLIDIFLPSVKDYRGKNITIRSNVVIEGPVHIGDNVKIYEFTKIVGPVYIGDNTIIGNNNIIRDSYIGNDCVTGFNTDITRSYIGNSCWFHSNYIGDSVLEGDVSLGSGNVLANLRLDEGKIYSTVRGERINTNRTKLGAIIGKHVRIGVNTSVMPGIKIGANSMIGAGLRIDRDIPDGSFVSGGTAMTIMKNMRDTKDNRKKLKNNLL